MNPSASVENEVVTLEDLISIMPYAPINKVEQYHTLFNDHFSFNNIVTKSQIAAFVANGAVDCFEFRELIDHLNYSASLIMQKWPEKFNIKEAQACAYNPEKLGNYLYANKYGNGSVYSGDGYKYRGRGFFKNIGKEFYEKMSEKLAVDFLGNPDLIIAPVYSVICACSIWTDLEINNLVEKDNIKNVFKKLSSNSNTIPDKLIYYNRALKILERHSVVQPNK